MSYIKLKFPRPKMTTQLTKVEQKEHSNPDIMNTRPHSPNPLKANQGCHSFLQVFQLSSRFFKVCIFWSILNLKLSFRLKTMLNSKKH